MEGNLRVSWQIFLFNEAITTKFVEVIGEIATKVPADIKGVKLPQFNDVFKSFCEAENLC